jgi:hypothetical protein
MERKRFTELCTHNRFGLRSAFNNAGANDTRPMNEEVAGFICHAWCAPMPLELQSDFAVSKAG